MTRSYASAVTAASGGLGIIIPPSIPMVIFGISALGMNPPPEAVEKFGQFASLSIPKLFVAGVFPGIVMAGGLLVMNYFISKKNGYTGLTENWSFGDIGKSLKRGFWSILAPFIILGGIYSGLFTPTESAIVAIFYTLFVGIVHPPRAEAAEDDGSAANHHLDHRAGAADPVHRDRVRTSAGRAAHPGTDRRVDAEH